MPKHERAVLSDPQQDHDQKIEKGGADSTARQAEAENIRVD